MANGILNGNAPMSRYVGGILQAVIIVLLLSFGSNVIDNGKAIAVISTKLDVIVKSDEDHGVRIRVLESRQGG